MSIITTMRRQKAVYWAFTGNDRFGKPTWDDPVEIDCRWEDGDGLSKDQKTELGEFDTLVYVDRVTPKGGMLLLGLLSSATPSDPKLTEAREIQKFKSLPNLRNTETLYTAMLKFGA